MQNIEVTYLFLLLISLATVWIFIFLYRRLKLLKETELQLKLSRESLEFALESGGMGTWEINLQNDTVICSKEMLDLWNIRPEEFNGLRSQLQEKVHPADVTRMQTAIETAIRTKSIYEFEYRIYPSPGIERWVICRGRCTFPPLSDIPSRFSGVVYDITEIKIKEAATNEAITSRDQFFMIASHELRTPLACLELLLEVKQWDLKNHYPEAFTAEKLEQAVYKQKEQLLRLKRIVDNIVDESKISKGRLQIQLEDFNLTEMIRKVLEQFSLTAKSHDVEIFFSPEIEVFGRWDQFRLEQVLFNLLLNAIRYGNRNPIQVEVSKDEETAIFIVRDRGIGVKPEDQSRIFERYERVTSDHEIRGMGLGLFIAKSIVIEHGGEIRLISEHGKGSEFSVILPLNPKVITN